MSEYRVTICIESGEEAETMEFWTEAASLAEAVENIKNELDIC